MKWIGIDPGKKGGVASIDETGLIDIHPMPESVKDIIKLVEGSKHIFLEKAQAFPGGQGVVSTFTYAEMYGIIQGILIAEEIPHTLITPRNWQKIMFVGTKDKIGSKKRNPKDRALEAANRIFCKSNEFWFKSKRCKKPHDGMIDAILIAECCRRMIN